MIITVDKVVDHEDGSCTVTFDMDIETLKTFAVIGLYQVLTDKAKEVLDGHSNPEGKRDAEAGGDGDPPVR